MNILVVEDIEFERVRLKALLTALGHQTIEAVNGLDALELYHASVPDLILMDVCMPIMDGLETAKKIREQSHPWVPIIFLSANVEPEDVARGIEAGGDDYLSKPVHSVVLRAKLLAMQRILAMQKLMDQVSAPNVRADIVDLAAVDSQTGFATAEAGYALLAREFIRCSRSAQSVSLVHVAVDGYSDLLPDEAERCIKAVSIALQSNASRMSDFIARYPAGVFSIVMPETPLTGAIHVAERIRDTIEHLYQFSSVDDSLTPTFTVSLGVATVVPQKDHDATHLDAAAKAMVLQAQQEGGNCVHATAVDAPFRLTARELECLQWSAIGKSSWEISTILNISESAVNFHMANIRSKFNVSSRRQAVVQAIRYGLIRAV